MNKFFKEKNYGDAKRIYDLYVKKCKDKEIEPLSYGSIRAMLNGSRTMSDEVSEIATPYFEKMSSILN